MNWARALTLAQTNANYARAPRYVFLHNRAVWISNTPVAGATRVDPQPSTVEVS